MDILTRSDVTARGVVVMIASLKSAGGDKPDITRMLLLFCFHVCLQQMASIVNGDATDSMLTLVVTGYGLPSRYVFII